MVGAHWWGLWRAGKAESEYARKSDWGGDWGGESKTERNQQRKGEQVNY